MLEFYFIFCKEPSINCTGKEIKTISQLNKFSKEMNILILCFIQQAQTWASSF